MVIVIPCYREAERLPRFLPGLCAELQGLGCTVQVVDDGSPAAEAAATERLVETIRAEFPGMVEPLKKLPVNRGKGAAVRAGWLAHPEALQLGFTDADGAVSPREVARLVKLAMLHPEKALFASRVKILGREIRRNPVRHLCGRVFATLVSLKLKEPVYDTQCGLKILPGPAFFSVSGRFQENGFAFDVELLLLLRKLGVPIEEVPVDWSHIPGSKVNLLRDSVSMWLAIGRMVKRNASWTSSSNTR